MKTKTMILAISSVVGLLLISGFSNSTNKVKPGKYVSIPTGSTEINGQQVSLDSYWISDHEVTNEEYNNFLADLKEQGKTKELEICKINSTTVLAKLFESYHTHQAFSQYPVLNITHEAAKLYCEWLTEKSEDKSQIYRLPTKIEWIYAAKGGLESSAYAWDGKLRNKKGVYMCNFRPVGDEFIHVDSSNNYKVMKEYEELNDSSSFTATTPVDTYSPNGYGLYNVCGNAAEMINEEGIAMGGSWINTGYDVRVTSEQKYKESCPYIGFRPVRVTKK